MNKTAVKNYAVEARKKWIQAIAQQAAFYGCTEKSSLNEADITKQLVDKGVFLTANEKSARSALVNDINEKGYQNAIEEIAYTWFNRLIAIRFMEVNGYLPSGIRVLSSIDADRIEPDCVREYARLDFLNQDTAAKLAAESDEKLYRYILVEQCNALGKIMPKMFTHIGGIAALLLPERLYIKDGLVHDLTHIKDVEEKDFGEQIETIGWLYQYYISEKKDEVFAALKKNVKITRENIPAATQLFTPEWIVKYMVENSLGRLWLESHPDSKLREGWKYYIDEAEQEPTVAEQLRVLRVQNPVNKPEEIKLIDPCMGSGHILVYAFDVLFQIYQSQGYSEREIPDLILENNIYGLDIDERACQLAYFALMMKARSYNRRFFRREEGKAVPQPQVYSPQADAELLEYGSLYKIDILDPMPEQAVGQIALEDIKHEDKLNDWNFRRLLHQKYDVVVTNPPYMGSKGMGAKLSEYAQKNYPDSKSDTFAIFIEKCGVLTKSCGYYSLITQQAWMFLSGFYELRKKYVNLTTIVNMAHLGFGAFGADFGTTAFVGLKCSIKKYLSVFVKLGDKRNVDDKRDVFLSGGSRYISSISKCENMFNFPFAYWASKNVVEIFFNMDSVSKFFTPKQGIITGNANEFTRFWHEVSLCNIGVGSSTYEDIATSQKKWFPFNNGGGFWKWNGNRDYVVDMWNEGHNIKYSGKNNNYRLREPIFYFKPSVTWNAITSSNKLSVRYNSKGFLFSNAEMAVFNKIDNNTDNLIILAAFLNSRVADFLLTFISPTLNFNQVDIENLPLELHVLSNKDILKTTKETIEMASNDWDSFETSRDFQTHPLIHGVYKQIPNYRLEASLAQKYIEAAFMEWERETDDRFNTLKANEEELNRIFIDIYGLQDELTPEVEDKDVTVRRADLGREIRSLISYAVGCMFGRYSLDVPGLAFAGGDWDSGKYQSYIPEDDNILPITDADYFEDDIVMRFVDFVKVVYGEDTLTENLEFIARALYPNGNGTAREMIRRYFQNDFFKDHCKIYQKRPIYWLFDSGKQNGFKALIYLHRYDKYTVARVRTEYLHPLQRKYEAEIERMDKLAVLPETSARDKAEFRKQTEKIEKQIAECRAYDQIISHIAAQTIELDLDDGVKVNYEKFQGVEVPRDDGKGSVKMDLLGKI